MRTRRLPRERQSSGALAASSRHMFPHGQSVRNADVEGRPACDQPPTTICVAVATLWAPTRPLELLGATTACFQCIGGGERKRSTHSNLAAGSQNVEVLLNTHPNQSEREATHCPTSKLSSAKGATATRAHNSETALRMYQNTPAATKAILIYLPPRVLSCSENSVPDDTL